MSVRPRVHGRGDLSNNNENIDMLIKLGADEEAKADEALKQLESKKKPKEWNQQELDDIFDRPSSRGAQRPRA